MSRYSTLESKVYVGDLPRDASEKDLERAFAYYGPLRNVWVARNPAGFAFVEYEDPRDAEDAVRGMDGTNICGSRVRVEHSTGKVRPKPWLRGSRGLPRSRRAFNPDDRCYECGERGHYAYDCTRYRRGGGGGGSRDRRNSRRSSRSRSRSRSPRRRYSSSSPSRSRSRSPRRYRTRSRTRSNSRASSKHD